METCGQRPNHCERLYDFPLLSLSPHLLPPYCLSLIGGRGREGRFPATAQGGEKNGQTRKGFLSPLPLVVYKINQTPPGWVRRVTHETVPVLLPTIGLPEASTYTYALPWVPAPPQGGDKTNVNSNKNIRGTIHSENESGSESKSESNSKSNIRRWRRSDGDEEMDEDEHGDEEDDNAYYIR